MAARTRSRRILPKLLVVLVVSAIGLEVGVRVLDRVRGKPWVAEERRAAIEEVCRQLSRVAFTPAENRDEPRDAQGFEGSVLQPYVAWEHPSTQTLIAQDVEYFRTPASKTALDVYLLGGSVAQLFGQLGVQKLVQGLQVDPGLRVRPIRVHNYACAGYKQPQQAMNLAYLLALGHEPDVVIDMDGFNEAALGWNNAKSGANPLYPSLPHWARATNGIRADPEMVGYLHEVRVNQDRAREFGEWFLRSGLWRSAFVEHVGSLRLERLRRRYIRAYAVLTTYIAERPKEAETSGPEFPRDDEGIAEMIVRSWTENSMSLAGMCQERGIAYLHVLQPTLHDEGSKPLTQKEIDGATATPDWIEGVKKLYPRLREAGSKLVERGVAFRDMTRVFQDHPEDVYYDVCHFKEHGNEILAAAVAVELSKILKDQREKPR
ncbi:MAG: hypothetical protein ACKVXR_01495 [Planctomycetota bacterium]